MSSRSHARARHVVVLGAGFAGLAFCRYFRAPATRITWIDHRNYHLFQPLLYQVATGWLSASDITHPVRSLVRGRDDIQVVLTQVTSVDPARRRVATTDGVYDYDYLVVALGGVPNYFGHPEWEACAPGLKTLEDALRVRTQLLMAFERAENRAGGHHAGCRLTFTVVGGGPTGVELAGALAELTRRVLNREFRRIEPARTRVILLEAGQRILPGFPSRLAAWAATRLSAMGVEVRTGTRVIHVAPGELHLADGERIETDAILWAAGVVAHPLARQLGESTDAQGRVRVRPDLSLPRYPEVFVLGDMARAEDEAGHVAPPLAPAALQMGRHVARLLQAELRGRTGSPRGRAPFRYRDPGCMVTLGRGKAVARWRNWELTGRPAWLAWLFVHLMKLVGFRNRAAVFVQWAWAYGMDRPGARIIYGHPAAAVIPTQNATGGPSGGSRPPSTGQQKYFHPPRSCT